MVLTEPYRDCNVDLSALISNEDTRQAIEVLQKRKRGVNQSYSIEGLNGKFEDLEEGVYLLEGMSQEEHEMQSVLVSIPAIDDKTGELIYDIEVTPKMISMYSVDTGDDNSVVVIGVICMISLLFVIRTLYFSLRLC